MGDRVGVFRGWNRQVVAVAARIRSSRNVRQSSRSTSHAIRYQRRPVATIRTGSTALRDAGVEFPPVGRHPAAAHVETKIAALMRENGITYGVVVINNDRGPCGADPTSERRFSCGVSVPAILPAGSTLAVWFPGAVEAVMLRGQASE